jgi:GntR family transcriptional regulator
MTRKPKYAQIQEDLIRRIEEKEYPAGSEFPSETDLMDTYNVSRITVRRVIDELARDGYLDKSQGKRTTVRTAGNRQELSYTSSFTEEIIRMGMTPSRKVVNSQLRLPTKTEKEQLKIEKTDAVYTLKRVYYADEKPMCYTETCLPYGLFPGLDREDFGESSLYEFLNRTHKVQMEDTLLQIKAIAADTFLAKTLNIKKGIPVLLMEGTTFGQVKGETRAIETFRNFYVTEGFSYSLIQSRR